MLANLNTDITLNNCLFWIDSWKSNGISEENI